MEVDGQIHAPTALPRGKSLWYSFDRILGESQSQSGRHSNRTRTSDSSDIQPVVSRLERANLNDWSGDRE
jgi:hypothetical protein